MPMDQSEPSNIVLVIPTKILSKLTRNPILHCTGTRRRRRQIHPLRLSTSRRLPTHCAAKAVQPRLVAQQCDSSFENHPTKRAHSRAQSAEPARCRTNSPGMVNSSRRSASQMLEHLEWSYTDESISAVLPSSALTRYDCHEPYPTTTPPRSRSNANRVPS